MRRAAAAAAGAVPPRYDPRDAWAHNVMGTGRGPWLTGPASERRRIW